jgi:hypothetical protein
MHAGHQHGVFYKSSLAPKQKQMLRMPPDATGQSNAPSANPFLTCDACVATLAAVQGDILFCSGSQTHHGDFNKKTTSA